MTDIIRAVRGSWTPPPGRSLDPRVPIAPDHYRFAQNQIESEQRQAQRAVNRTVRSGRQGAPAASPVRTPFGIGPVPVIPLTPR